MKQYVSIAFCVLGTLSTVHAMVWHGAPNFKQKEQHENQTVIAQFNSCNTPPQHFQIPCQWLKEFELCKKMREYSETSEIVFSQESGITVDDFELLLALFEQLYKGKDGKPTAIEVLRILGAYNLSESELHALVTVADFLEISLLLEVLPAFLFEKILSGLRNSKKLLESDSLNPIMQQKIADRIELKRFFELYKVPHVTIQEHADRVCASRCGIYMVSTSDDGQIKVWNSTTGVCLNRFNTNKDIRSLCVSPDNQTIAIGDANGVITLWDTATGTLVKQIDGGNEKIISVCFNAQGTTLVSGSEDGKIQLWDIKTGKCMETDKNAFEDKLDSVWFDHHDTMVAVSRTDRSFLPSFTLWNVETGTMVLRKNDHINSFSYDGNTYCDVRGNDLRLCNATNSTSIKKLSVPHALASSFSPDGTIIAFGGNTILLLNIPSMYRAYKELTVSQKIALYALENGYITVHDIETHSEWGAIFETLDADVKKSYMQAYEEFLPKVKQQVCSWWKYSIVGVAGLVAAYVGCTMDTSLDSEQFA